MPPMFVGSYSHDILIVISIVPEFPATNLQKVVWYYIDDNP